MSKTNPSLAGYTTGLITHPSYEVPQIAAALGTLDETDQRILAADPLPRYGQH